jgi:hypothetical protein
MFGNHRLTGFFHTQVHLGVIHEFKLRHLLVPGGATLNALGINAVNIAFQRDVAAASFTGFYSDETEHFSPYLGSSL